MSKRLIDVYADKCVLNAHYLLLLNLQHPIFFKILACKLNGQVTIQQFADIFGQVLYDVLNNFTIN